MSKQDRQGVRNASDLERKYDFSLISGDGKGYSRQAEQINNLTQAFAQFVALTNGRLAELEGNTKTWFFKGVPTLENEPAVDWDTEEKKEEHIGDMYFDEDDSCTYLFKRTETGEGEEKTVEYEWVAMFDKYKEMCEEGTP